MAGCEARHDADRCADVQTESRRLLVWGPLLAGRIRQLVPAKRGHVQAEIAEAVEGLVEALVRVALLRQRADESPPFVEDLLFEVVADAVDARAVLLLEVEVLERRVQLDERRANPGVEGLDVPAHSSKLTTEGRAPSGSHAGLRFRGAPPVAAARPRPRPDRARARRAGRTSGTRGRPA